MKSKYSKIAILSAIACFFQINFSQAQGVVSPCATDQKNEEMMLQHPELRQAYIDYVNSMNQKASSNGMRSTTLYTIPVVFHIIHINGTENISDANVYAQMTRLNTDFAKLNTDFNLNHPYFQPFGADALIKFELAKIDPNGNCTNGIDRIYSHKTLNAGERSKLNQWPRDKYFNVWVINVLEVDPGTTGLVLAYATFPSSVNTFGFPSDGVIMRADQCNGTSRTLTHEVGHWLGLEHVWGNGEVATACGDDGINDTPVTKGHFSTCPTYDHACDSKTLTSSFNFGAVTTTSGTTDPTPVPEATDSTITYTNFNAVGVSANSNTAGMFEFSDWGLGGIALDSLPPDYLDTAYSDLTGAIDLTKYYEFTITPDSFSNSVALTTITFNFQRNATGVRTYAVRSSADGFATNLPASISPADTLLRIKAGNVFFCRYDTTMNLIGSRVSLSGHINNVTRTFRIYAWNAEDSTGTFGIDNLTVNGTHGLIENITNYMDYSSCTYMFTAGQILRMRNTVESPIAQRSSLWINSNLAATGTDGATLTPCTPTTDFFGDDQMICGGGNIAFSPQVLNLSQSSTATYAWTFPGGTPSSSTLASPVIVYNTPGVYDVTLTVSAAGAGSTTVTKTNYITVSQTYAQVSNTYVEGFENLTNFYDNWVVNDLDHNGKTWWVTTSAAYSGSRSIVMNGYYGYRDDVDQLISPSYNLTFISSPFLNFKLAAATKATSTVDINDKLIVYSSTDCGASWNAKATYTGTALLNNSYHPEEFAPTSTSQWVQKSINVATAIGPRTRFKFEYTSGDGSNSIYIDDINITGTLAIDENSIETANVSIYPNPANQTATLSYHLNKKGNTSIELVDVLGKKIMQVNNNGQTEGDYSIQISKSELNLLNGIYFVKFTIDNTTITKKLVISE